MIFIFRNGMLGFGCLLMMAAGCGPPRAHSEPQTLPGARFEIPVYPGARVVSQNTVIFYDSVPPAAPVEFDATTWELTTPNSADTIVAFYEGRLPSNRRIRAPRTEANETQGREETETEYTYQPFGAETDESVSIVVGEGTIEISQVTRRE